MIPYTPDAIQYVRQCSVKMPASRIAAVLDWDLATLRERARKHGIELLAPDPMVEVEPDAPPAPTAEASTGGAGNSGRWIIPIDGDLHQVIASLPPRQADVLTALSQFGAEKFMSGQEIAKVLETQICTHAINQLVNKVKRRLLETRRWRIESRQRRNGGHRLVHLQEVTE